MPSFNRRNFLKATGISMIPALGPIAPIFANSKMDEKNAPKEHPVIKFYGDGEIYNPLDYITELQKANALSPIISDSYGSGGAIEELQKKFAEITGKEKAIYLPTGTMANQLALTVLSGENTKIIVQENSHVFRDEADAAQSVFGKRLIPLGKGNFYFNETELRATIESMPENEVFQSNVGVLTVENPIRRADGRVVPLDEIKKISNYCRINKIKLHLDGARIYLASAWTGVPVNEYASYFDTVYISLYKYLGAGGGAVLCGEKNVIDKIPHLIKVHGGNMFTNWANAAMALHKLEGLENRLQESIKTANIIFTAINKIPGMTIKPLEGGTNIYTFTISNNIDGKKLRDKLAKDYGIIIPRPYPNIPIKIMVNETLLYQHPDYIINAFSNSI